MLDAQDMHAFAHEVYTLADAALDAAGEYINAVNGRTRGAAGWLMHKFKRPGERQLQNFREKMERLTSAFTEYIQVTDEEPLCELPAAEELELFATQEYTAKSQLADFAQMVGTTDFERGASLVTMKLQGVKDAFQTLTMSLLQKKQQARNT